MEFITANLWITDIGLSTETLLLFYVGSIIILLTTIFVINRLANKEETNTKTVKDTLLPAKRTRKVLFMVNTILFLAQICLLLCFLYVHIKISDLFKGVLSFALFLNLYHTGIIFVICGFMELKKFAGFYNG